MQKELTEVENTFKQPEALLLNPKMKSEKREQVIQRHRSLAHSRTIKRLLTHKIEELYDESPRRKLKTHKIVATQQRVRS